MNITREQNNNFDLLRLVAAIQIALYHCNEHLQFASPVLQKLFYSFRYFFGIHILFTISGFLIFSSYNSGRNNLNYFRNRFLRVYPGLWTCLLITIAMLVSLGYISAANIFSKDFWIWIGAQSTFFQFYTPDMLRGFGVHNPNGALWTIPVEVTWYLFIPLLFLLFRRLKINRNLLLLTFMAGSIAFNVLYQPYKFQPVRSEFIKLLGVSILPYLFYFLLGAIAANNWERIKRWYIGKGLVWLAAYIVWCLVFCFWLHKFRIGYWTNFYHFIAVILLSQGTIALAYTYRNLSRKLLFGNDLSYGIYIYHMPVVNVLIELGYRGNNNALFIVIIVVGILAYLSWKLVEHPALMRKKYTV